MFSRPLCVAVHDVRIDDLRGGAFYDDDAVREAYLHHRHDGARSPNRVMEEPAFLAAVGSVSGCRVLDLGCGDGATAPMLLGAGAASYLGVDGSAGMIREARARHDLPGARFVKQNIEDVAEGDGSFDLVVSRMALHYVERLDRVLERMHRSLTNDGQLVFSVVHPVITSHDSLTDGLRTTWTVDRYFERGPRERSWFGSSVTWHHRTVEDYVRLLLGNGFAIETLSECEPDPVRLADDPDELTRRRRVPLMLVLGARRIADSFP